MPEAPKPPNLKLCHRVRVTQSAQCCHKDTQTSECGWFSKDLKLKDSFLTNDAGKIGYTYVCSISHPFRKSIKYGLKISSVWTTGNQVKHFKIQAMDSKFWKGLK